MKGDYRCWAQIDLKAFAENISRIKAFVGSNVKLLQVVKADGYGHGALEVAKVALVNGVYGLGVANAEEGIALRLGGIQAPILILSPSLPAEVPGIVEYGLSPSLSDDTILSSLFREALKAQRKVIIHIEVDTGMGRSGIRPEETGELARNILSQDGFELGGIFSHFASADLVDRDFCSLQVERFKEVIEGLKREGIIIPLRHMANSAAILEFPESYFDLVRPGLLSYGLYPSERVRKAVKVKPVLSFKTKVAQTKKILPGETISYGRTWKAKTPTRVAVIPIGYGDGYDFLHSNKGVVLIKGRKAPIVGRVTMDLTMVDVSGIPDLQVEEEVTIIGRDGAEEITATEVAKEAGTLSYEVLCLIGKRAPRVYTQGGRVGGVRPALRRRNVLSQLIPPEEMEEIIKDCLQIRLNEEVGEALYHGILEAIFGQKGGELQYRKDLRHRIWFEEEEGRYLAKTEIEYYKTLRSDSFYVACAKDEDSLAYYFQDPRCEYRWLLEKGQLLASDFEVKGVGVDGLMFEPQREGITERGYEIHFQDPRLQSKLNQPVKIKIETQTWQEEDKRELPIYIVYPTNGMEVTFDYSRTGIDGVKAISFLASKSRYPQKRESKRKSITLSLKGWIFPNSGITFIW